MRALALTETADHVCGRYRVRAFAPSLEACGWSLVVEGLESNPVERFRQFERAREFDAVILQRKLLSGWQVGHLRRRSRRLIFDFDDAVLYRDSNDLRGPHSSRRSSRFRRTMEIVDSVIAGNDFLAECARQHGARPERIRVIPTCIDTDRYPIGGPKPCSAGIDLAWIGSSSTLLGLESQRPTWERIGHEVPGSRLRLICDRFPKFANLEVVPITWQEATEASELGKADVGVSWIPDGLWSRGKCGLKILQYQAAGLPVIANPVGVHPEMIQEGETGWLALTADDWVNAVRTLRESPEERQRMGMAARRSVERDYSIAAWGPTFVGTIAGHATPPAPRSRRKTPDSSVRPMSGHATGTP